MCDQTGLRYFIKKRELSISAPSYGAQPAVLAFSVLSTLSLFSSSRCKYWIMTVLCCDGKVSAQISQVLPKIFNFHFHHLQEFSQQSCQRNKSSDLCYLSFYLLCQF